MAAHCAMIDTPKAEPIIRGEGRVESAGMYMANLTEVSVKAIRIHEFGDESVLRYRAERRNLGKVVLVP